MTSREHSETITVFTSQGIVRLLSKRWRFEDNLDLFGHDERNRSFSDAAITADGAGANARTRKTERVISSPSALPNTYLRSIDGWTHAEVMRNDTQILGDVFRGGGS